MPTAPKDLARLDLPSASGFEIVVQCPGSVAMKASLPPEALADEPDETAETGTKLHKASETGDTSDLTGDELEMHETGVENEKKLVETWGANEGLGMDYVEGPREERLWLHDAALNPVTSGQIDKHWLATQKPSALIVDAKSGWLFWKLKSQQSWQLKLQAVLLKNEYANLEHVRVAYNKLKTRGGWKDFTDYSATDLTNAQFEIQYHLWLSQQPDAPRRAGPWCNWCEAKAFCPEAGALSLLPSVIAKDMLEVVDAMQPADLKVIWQKSPIITKIIDRVKFRLKGLAPEQMAAIGLETKDGRKLDSITNHIAAFAALNDDGIEPERLWEALEFSKTKLVEVVRASKGLSAKDASEYLDQKLDPFIQRKRGDKMLIEKV